MYLSAKNVIVEALRANAVTALYIEDGTDTKRAKEILSLARKRSVRIETLSREAMRAMTKKSAPLVARVDETNNRAFDIDTLIEKAKEDGPRPALLLLDGVTDVRNFGAIARSAYFFGASGIIVAKDNAAPVNEAAHETSQGALYRLPVTQTVNLSRALERLKEAGYWIYLADGEGERALHDVIFDRPSVIILGSENKGARENIRRHADFRVRIQRTNEFDSLNVSVAAAIFMYAWSRGQ